MKLKDWEPRLAAYLESVREMPHAFGKHDCAIFVAGGVKAVTGKDKLRGRRGRYKDERGAYRHLKALGFRNMEGLLDSLFEEKSVAFAQRGDLVLADGIPGICIGGEALFAGDEGLIRKPRAEWQKAWAV